MKSQPFIIERTFYAPIDYVWRAITEKELMKQWYFDLPEFKAEVGFEFTFEGGEDPNKPYLHLCKITAVEIGKKIAYSWRYDGFEGDSMVTFELFEEEENTKLKLTHAGLESFPTNNPDFAKANFEKGWTFILDNSLKEFLGK